MLADAILKINSEAGTKEAYLDVVPVPEYSRLVRGAKTADFGRKVLPWKLCLQLLQAAAEGASKGQLQDYLGVSEASLRNHKSTAEGIIEPLRLEIAADMRGIWVLKEM